MSHFFAFPYCFIGMRGRLCRICEVHVTHTKERDSAPSPSPRLFAGNKCLSVTSVYNAVENAACLHPGGKFLKPVFSIPKFQTVFVTQAFTDRMTANCVSPHEVFDQQRGTKKVLKMRTFCLGPFPLVTNLIRNVLAFIEARIK